MSQLGFIEKLLGGSEVEVVPISVLVKKTHNIKWKEALGSHRYIDLASVDIQTKSITQTTVVTSETAPSRAQKLVQKDDVIFATTRPMQMRFTLIDEEFDNEVASSGYCVLRADQNLVLPKWILHCVSTKEFKLYLEEHQSGAAYPAISDSKIKAFEIPIPCPNNPEKSLAIQAEIVGILDTFTELTTELNARKKQYNYYRDKLLSFDEGEAEWKTLDNIGGFAYGYAAKAQPAGDARFVRITDINANGKLSPEGQMYVEISEENEKYLLKKMTCLWRERGQLSAKQ